jgi:hypothetical protein
MYGPGRGRFMQPDPAGLKGAKVARPETLNRYAYVHNDPVNLVDRNGAEGERPYDPFQALWDLWAHSRDLYAPLTQPEDANGGGSIFDYKMAYEACRGIVNDVFTIDTDLKTNFTADVALKILWVTGQVGGISEALLAVTWAMESRFTWNPVSNEGHIREAIGPVYDIGPMQLNDFYTADEIKRGVYSLAPYSWEQVLGTSWGSTVSFNGDPHANIMIGARKLAYLVGKQGSEIEAAGGYVTLNDNNLSSQNRKSQYDKYSSGLGNFFDCFKNQLGL